jgi:hypothetical protein
MSQLELCSSVTCEKLSIKYAIKILTFVALLYSIIFIMPLAAVKETNQNCAVTIPNDTVTSEYRSAVLAKKNIYAAKGRNYCPCRQLIITDRLL